jgi:phage tail protein X
MVIYAQQNESIDEIAYRLFGRTKGLVELIYKNNPKLCLLPATLPLGTKVIIPDVVPQASKKMIKLWD